MHDFARERVCPDRLGLKLYLIQNDHDQLDRELDGVFHSEEVLEVQQHIRVNLDPANKGYIELDDLNTAVEDKISDKRVQVRLNAMIADNLEYRNTDAVFYSPILGLPAPYFRYAGNVELFSVVFKMA